MMVADGARRFARCLPVLLGCAVLGGLEAAAFAPLQWWPLSIACIAALWWLWDRQTPLLAAWSGFAFGAGLFGVGTWWTFTAVHVVSRVPVPLALVLTIGLVVIMAIYYAIVGWLYARVRLGHPLIDHVTVLPALWLLMEWFRGWFLTGFPWLSLGYAQIDTPLAGYAQFVGVYGVGLAAALVAAGLLALASGAWRLGAVTVLVVYALGFALRTVTFVHASGPPVTVAIVQGAISQDEKWLEENRGPTLELYRRMTRSAYGSQVIFWPESTLPQLYHELVPYLSQIYAEARAQHSDLVLGLVRYDPTTDSIRNGLVALGDDEQWYYKRHLVPFGEYLPIPSFVRDWLRVKNLAFFDLTPGAAIQPPLSAAGLRLGESICYEDSYGAEQLAVLGHANALVNVSNDAWFGDSSAPHQHLQITRMRALEAGRYMIRATNNGISAIIAPDGRVLARSRQFVPEVLRGSVTPYEGLTPYARLRNYPEIAFCAIALGGAVWSRRRRRAAATATN